MVNTKLLAAVVIVIVIVGAVAAWQLISPPASDRTTIKIGLVAPYQIPVGQDMDRAARMAVEEINAMGGIYVESLGQEPYYSVGNWRHRKR